MTLIFDPDLDIMQMYLCTTRNFGSQGVQKLRARTEQTDRRDWTHYQAVFAGGNYC